MLRDPHRCAAADSCPFTLTAATSNWGLSRARHLLRVVGAALQVCRCDQIDPLASRWVCQEACPGPSHLGQGASRNKNSWGLNLRIAFPPALIRPGQAGGHDTNCTKIVTMLPPRVPTQVAQEARGSIWPLSRVLRPLHLRPARPAAPLSAQIKSHHDCASRQRASEARGMSRKVVRSSASTVRLCCPR